MQGQLDQVLSRLFPFKRGLTHAYWAPNFWALYNFADKIAIKIGSYFGLSMSSVAREAALTAGIVGDDEHSMLPSITPLLTIMLTVLSMLPALIKVWCHPNDFDGFVRSVVLCAFSSFLFGWHVHEKAIILILVPLSLLAVSHSSDASVYFILSTTGHVSLFPLLFLPAENLLRVVPTLLYMIFTYYALIRAICPRREEDARAQLFCNHPLPVLYLLGLLLTQSYCIGVHQFTAFGKRLPFLPLMLTSVYCAVGVVVAWFSCYATMLRLPESEKED
jgi:alpha-1,3-glucosyltransferase